MRRLFGLFFLIAAILITMSACRVGQTTDQQVQFIREADAAFPLANGELVHPVSSLDLVEARLMERVQEHDLPLSLLSGLRAPLVGSMDGLDGLAERLRADQPREGLNLGAPSVPSSPAWHLALGNAPPPQQTHRPIEFPFGDPVEVRWEGHCIFIPGQSDAYSFTSPPNSTHVSFSHIVGSIYIALQSTECLPHGENGYFKAEFWEISESSIRAYTVHDPNGQHSPGSQRSRFSDWALDLPIWRKISLGVSEVRDDQNVRRVQVVNSRAYEAFFHEELGGRIPTPLLDQIWFYGDTDDWETMRSRASDYVERVSDAIEEQEAQSERLRLERVRQAAENQRDRALRTERSLLAALHERTSELDFFYVNSDGVFQIEQGRRQSRNSFSLRPVLLTNSQQRNGVGRFRDAGVFSYSQGRWALNFRSQSPGNPCHGQYLDRTAFNASIGQSTLNENPVSRVWIVISPRRQVCTFGATDFYSCRMVRCDRLETLGGIDNASFVVDDLEYAQHIFSDIAEEGPRGAGRRQIIPQP